jgi:energy-coupling factor transporter ATP-binding protein EcfA2
MPNSTPAWPRRPPLWTSAALLLSLLLGAVYCWIAVRSRPPIQASLLPTYVQSAIWSALPPLPTFRKRVPNLHRFRLPDHSVIVAPPKALYRELRFRVFEGKTVRQLFTWAMAGILLTSLFLLVVGGSLDRAQEATSRDGRHIRGPRLVSRFRFNLASGGQAGLRFPLTLRRNLLERFRGEHGFDLVIRRAKEAQHIQISGDTGSGKSTLGRTILYQIEERGETAIVFDPDREYLREFFHVGRGDIILNPKDQRCPYWAIGEEASDEAEATPIAEGLFPDHPTAQLFFLKHTRAIFAYLLAYYRPTVNELGHWMAHPEEIDRRVKDTEHAHTMTENAAPQRAGILGTLNEAGMSLRMMPSHLEGRQKFTVRAWSRKRHGWIFVSSTPDTIDALRPLQGLWLDMLILKLQGERSDRDARRCWLVLDEVQELNKLPQLPKALTKQRKSGNPIVIGFQGMSQIDAHYGKQAETMLSQPFNNFILRSKEPRAAKYLSDLIGRVQIERLRETKPASFLGGNRQRSYNTERVIESLVLDSEIQGLEDLTGYFLQGGKVVRVQFAVRAPRILAPGLIERIIPGVQKRPLDPERVQP